MERAQVVYLTLGALLALALSFALGVVVGRRAAQFGNVSTQGEDPLARADAANALQQQLTFYNKLTDRAPPRVATPPPVTPSAAQPAKAAEPSAAPTVATPAAANPVVTSAAPSTPASTPNAGAPAAATAPDTVLTATLNHGPAQKGEYTVQVAAFQSEAEANAFVAALKRKGFTGHVVRAALPGKGTWYRVRLGRFSADADANRATKLLLAADVPGWVVKSE